MQLQNRFVLGQLIYYFADLITLAPLRHELEDDHEYEFSRGLPLQRQCPKVNNACPNKVLVLKFTGQELRRCHNPEVHSMPTTTLRSSQPHFRFLFASLTNTSQPRGPFDAIMGFLGWRRSRRPCNLVEQQRRKKPG